MHRYHPEKIFVVLILGAGLYLTTLYHYLLFHNLAELFSIVIAAAFFMIAWNSRELTETPSLVYLGIAYLFIAILDLFHTLSYKGMNIFTDYDFYANQLWIAARYLESLTLLLFFIFLRSDRKIPYPLVYLVYTLATLLILLSVFYWKNFPVCFIEGKGLTPFKKISEYIICFILLLSLYFAYKNRDYFQPDIFRLLAFSVFFTIGSELAFTFYISNYGFSNLVGHYFKIASFYLVYKAIIETGLKEPFQLIFRKLKQSEEKYRMLFENMLVACAYHKIVLNENGEPTDFITLEVNRTYEEVCGIKRESILGKKASEALPAITRSKPDLIGLYGEVAEKGIKKRFSTYIVSMDKWFSIAAYSPEKNYFVITFDDITERKKWENRLKKAKEQAEEANQAKTLFLARMSHEIRTPINAVLGMTKLAIQTENPEETTRYMETVHYAAEHLKRVIADILDFSRIEAGKIELEHIDFDLYETLDNLKTIFQLEIHKKEIDFQIDISEDTPRYLKGDPARLRQILFNIIGNAAKFTDTGGIYIRIENLGGNDWQNNQNVRLSFSVKDTGPGIPLEKQAVIFESFTQADSSTSRKYGGTGLGLAISKQLVELMGGTIELKSREGNGCEFRFDLIFQYGNKNTLNDTNLKKECLEKIEIPRRKVLLVDDNPFNTKLAGILLDKMGLEFEIVNNGRAALDILSRERFDMVLMDVEMPEMDGLETTRLIRIGKAGQVNQSIPIIALTAHNHPEFKELCLKEGMNTFLSKPFNINDLKRILEN